MFQNILEHFRNVSPDMGALEMSCTGKVDSPSRPLLRTICFDALGLIKVVEFQKDKKDPQLIARWGEPDPQRCVQSVCLSNEQDPVLAISRKNGIVEILDPTTGALYSQVEVMANSVGGAEGELGRGDVDSMAGIHLFREDSLGTRSLLTCTEMGKATLHPLHLKGASPGCCESVSQENVTDNIANWRVCNAGSILCLQVDSSERHAVFGGKGVDANLWDLEKQSKTWEAKTPRRDHMGLISPPFVTSLTFLSKSDHRKVVVGTGHHQVRLYDIGAQRRPVLSLDFQGSPIKAMEGDPNGHTIFVGTGAGDLGSFDMRTGKLLGVFKGKCSGSIRSIARHPKLPIIASCGLDRYLRIFDVNTRQLLNRVFLKQHLMAVAFDIKSTLTSSSETGVLESNKSQDLEAEGNDQYEEDDLFRKSMKKKLKRKLRRKETLNKSKRGKKISSIGSEQVNEQTHSEHLTTSREHSNQEMGQVFVEISRIGDAYILACC